MNSLIEKISRIFDYLSTQTRMGLLMLVGLITVIVILFTLGRYTLVDHDFYTVLADRQQLREVELSVNRGTIFATLDPLRSGPNDTLQNTILATTSITQDLKVDPSASCNKTLLETFLVDIVYEHLCQDRSQASCFDNVLKFTNNYTLPENFSFSKDVIIDFLTPTVREQVNRVYKTRILFATNLSGEVINALLAIGNPGIVVVGDAVYVDPTRFDRSRGVSDIIGLTGTTPAELEDALELRTNRNVNIVEKLDSTLATRIREQENLQITLVNQQIGKKNRDDFISNNTFFECIVMSDHPVREYPEGTLASQLTGFVDRDGIGRLGIEGYFHDLLAGKSGKKEERVDSSKERNAIYDQDSEQEVKGVDLYLTVDPNIQNAVMKALENGVRTTGANSASAVVMDPKTGAIRAIGTYPTFDPERPGNVDKIVRFDPLSLEEPLRFLLGKTLFVESPIGTVKKVFENRLVTLEELRTEDKMAEALLDPTKIFYVYENGIGIGSHQNIAVMSPYEPGSIFKALTTAIGIDTGEIEPDMIYEDKGSIKIDEFKISNLDNEKCQGWKSFRNALNFSCNVGMINIVQRIGKPLFYEYLRHFGLGDITGITLDGEYTGVLETYEKWPRAKLFTMSFGQGIQVNLMQMAAAYSALANGGVYMQPYIVKKRVYPDGDTVETAPVAVRRVVSSATSQKITAMLTESAQVGFAKSGSVPGYALAGKTGTSQIASTQGGFERGENGRTNTSYAGYGPSSDPKFVIIVRFDRPRSTQYAEQSTAKTFGEISAFLFQYYGIPAGK